MCRKSSVGKPTLPHTIVSGTTSGALCYSVLEILVAADIIRTVVLQPTASNVIVLGLLVLIRTFLSWSLVLEIEERWPWQP